MDGRAFLNIKSNKIIKKFGFQFWKQYKNKSEKDGGWWDQRINYSLWVNIKFCFILKIDASRAKLVKSGLFSTTYTLIMAAIFSKGLTYELIYLSIFKNFTNISWTPETWRLIINILKENKFLNFKLVKQ